MTDNVMYAYTHVCISLKPSTGYIDWNNEKRWAHIILHFKVCLQVRGGGGVPLHIYKPVYNQVCEIRNVLRWSPFLLATFLAKDTYTKYG